VNVVRARLVPDEARSELAASGTVICRGLVEPTWLREAAGDAALVAKLANPIIGGAGLVSWDLFPASSLIRALYESAELLDFASAVYDRPMYRYNDPQAGLNLSVMNDGDRVPWHYDGSDFVISLCLQPADAGGGLCTRGKVLRVGAGDAVLLEGRRKLHGVTTVRGSTPRLAALFAFHRRPVARSPLLVRLARYGLLSLTRYQQGSPP
jgi:hypothetical protein